MTDIWVKRPVTSTSVGRSVDALREKTRSVVPRRRVNSGRYFVTVANSANVVTSDVAVVRAMTRQRLASPVRLPSGLRVRFSDSDGGLLRSGDVSGFTLHYATNISGTNTVWTAITNGIILTNGMLEFIDTSMSNRQPRFYRVIEQ